MSTPKKRSIVGSACSRCRQRKAKCSGERPVCSSCIERNFECEYDIADGFTRASFARHQLNDANTRLADFQTLFDHLIGESDQEATLLLASLRLGQNVSYLAQSLRDESAPENRSGWRSSVWSRVRRSPSTADLRESLGLDGAGDFDGDGRQQLQGTLDSSRSDDVQSARPWSPGQASISDLGPLFESDGVIEELTASHSAGRIRHSTETLSMMRAGLPSPPELSAYMHIDPKILETFSRDATPLARKAARSSSSSPPNPPDEISVPIWSLRVLTTTRSMPTYALPLHYWIQDARSRIGSGTTADDLCGKQPHITCILEKGAVEGASELSNIVAMAVMSFRPISLDVTHLALMCLFWWYLHWTIDPSAQTWASVPAFLRPTPYQFWMQHPISVDLTIWPQARELFCKNQALQTDARLLAEMSSSITCNWGGSISDALCKEGSTGQISLNPLARASQRSEVMD